jgi:hypothetical protein
VKGVSYGLIVLALYASTTVGAQSRVRDASPRQQPTVRTTSPQLQVRQQIAAFETALENAVLRGTQMLNQRLQASNTDNMVMLAGLTRARGFRLDDYGVVFDVEFPSMRRSVVWTMQELERANTGRAVNTADVAASLRPREIYQAEIADALANTVLGYKEALAVGANEWLTIAARESVFDRRFLGNDPNDTAITVILRIKGSDLQALRDGTLTREEGLKRVDVKHY